jgi:hypothetical protein
MRDEFPFGYGGTEVGNDGRQGYRVSTEHLVEHTIDLEPIPPSATLEVNGVELLDLTEQLRAAGVDEETFNVDRKDHRIAVGEAVLAAATSRFAAIGKRAMHMADTSRISGGAVYGEATVRSTSPGTALRAGHHAFHIDAYLPGVAEINNDDASVEAGADRYVDTWWHVWASDMRARNLSKQEIARVIREQSPGLVTIWVSLTPGEILQQPLVLCDKQTFVPGSGELQNTSTQMVKFPELNGTITLLRERSMRGARWLWQPQMRFGQAFLMSTTSTPHSAVHLLGGQDSAARISAEVRMFILDDDAEGLTGQPPLYS